MLRVWSGVVHTTKPHAAMQCFRLTSVKILQPGVERVRVTSGRSPGSVRLEVKCSAHDMESGEPFRVRHTDQSKDAIR